MISDLINCRSNAKGVIELRHAKYIVFWYTFRVRQSDENVPFNENALVTEISNQFRIVYNSASGSESWHHLTPALDKIVNTQYPLDVD